MANTFIQSPRGMRVNRQHPLARSLWGYWPLNEGMGDRAFDISGHNNHGTITTMTWEKNRYGHTLNSGANGKIALSETIGYASGAPFPDGLSFSCWVQPETSNNFRGITGEGGNSRIFYRIDQTNIYMYGANNSSLGTWANSPLDTTNWWHVGFWFVYDGTFTDVEVYVNGESLGIQSGSSGTSGFLFSQFAHYGNDTYDMDGSIQNVAVWDRKLSDDEFMWLYREPYAMIEQRKTPRIFYVESVAPSFRFRHVHYERKSPRFVEQGILRGMAG